MLTGKDAAVLALLAQVVVSSKLRNKKKYYTELLKSLKGTAKKIGLAMTGKRASKKCKESALAFVDWAKSLGKSRYYCRCGANRGEER